MAPCWEESGSWEGGDHPLNLLTCPLRWGKRAESPPFLPRAWAQSSQGGMLEAREWGGAHLVSEHTHMRDHVQRAGV